MILKRNFNEHSKEIVNWINGANDAISKKYVDKICFSIHSQINNELLESYTFSISYQNNDKSPTPQLSLSRDNHRNKKKNRNKNKNKNQKHHQMTINDEKSLKKNIDRFYRIIKFTLSQVFHV